MASGREALDSDSATFATGQAKARAIENEAYLETLIEIDRFPPGHKKSIDSGEAGRKTSDDLNTTDPAQIAQAAVAYQKEMRGKGVVIATHTAVRHVIKEAS